MLYHSVYSDKIIRVLGPWWHLHIGNFFTIFLLSKLVSILINKHFWEKVELRDQLLQNKIEPRVILLVVSNYYNLGFVNAFWISVFSLCIYTCTNISHRLVHIYSTKKFGGFTMVFRDINYLHIRSVSLTILPGLSYRAKGSVGVVKFASLKVQEHCRKWLLRKNIQ